MPDTSDRTERVAELQQAAVPHPAVARRQAISAIDAIYQDGLIVPSQPLDLAEGTPLHIHVEVQPVPPQPAVPIDLAAAFRLLLALSALALALFAQYTFMAGHSFSWTAFGAAALAVGMFCGALHRTRLPFQPAQTVPVVAQPALAWLPWRSGMLIGALVCSAIVLLALATPFIANYNVYLVPWVAAIALVLGAFGQARRPTRVATPFWPALAPAACITLLAFGLRAWRLDQFPATLGGDEAAQGLESVNVLHGILANPFVTGWTSVPTMSFYVAVPSLAIFGQTITALRLPWALVGTASVLATYLLAARLHGRLVACLAAGLLAGFHYHVHFSRLGSNQIADTLFVPAALLCLVQGYRLRRAGAWAWCGVWVGLAQFFYAGARFTAILIAITVAWFAIREGRSFLAARRTELAALLAGALVAAAPMFQYAIRFPNEYNGRFNTVGIFQPGWFEAEMELTGRTVPHILNEQFWSAFLAYNATSDRTTWYGSGEPFFGLLEGALFILGIGYALIHLRERNLFPFVAWWVGAMLLGGMFTLGPPSSQRLVTTAVPAVFFVALALFKLGQLAARTMRLPSARPLYAVLLLAIAVSNIGGMRSYFLEYSPRRIYGDINGIVATDLGYDAAAEMGASARMYFFGAPRMYGDFPTIRYLAPSTESVDVLEPLQQPPAPGFVLPDKDAVFVFLPERLAELHLVQQTYPHGTLRYVMSPVSPDNLFTLYRVPKAFLGIPNGQIHRRSAIDPSSIGVRYP